MDIPDRRVEYGRFLATKPVNTARTYFNAYSRFVAWCYEREIDPESCTRECVERWVGERLLYVSRSRAYNDVAALRYFFSWLLSRGARADNPAAGIVVKRDRSVPTRPLTTPDLQTLLDACSAVPQFSPHAGAIARDRVMLLVMGSTGCRVGELEAMRVEDFDARTGELRLRGKGSKQRLAVLPDGIALELAGLLFGRRAGPMWLSRWGNPMSVEQLRKRVYAIAKRAGLASVHPHRFRAGFATSFIEETGDLQALQVILGHESVSTTARYTEYTKQRRALDLMRRFNPTSALL